MALCMQVYHQDGSEGLTPDAGGGFVGWSAWHWMRFLDALDEELGTEDRKPPDEYVFVQDHEFVALETNVWDRGGEEGVYYTLKIKAGDVYRCWRDR